MNTVGTVGTMNNTQLAHQKLEIVTGIETTPAVAYPIWIRIPRNGNCPITGLSKAKLYQLISGHNPPVRSVVLKEGDQTRGTRLIHLQSLLDYIASFEK